jgi:uncharacterized membrane protein
MGGLFVCLFGWLVVWLVGWLFGWLVGWLVDQIVARCSNDPRPACKFGHRGGEAPG